MTELLRRKNVDYLINHFWKSGYLTISRKFGTYLPEPNTVGGFEIDVVARHKNQYALGITINDEDLKNKSALVEKIKYLATRQTRKSKLPVMLFIGVREENYKEIKYLIENLEANIQKNIKLFTLNKPQSITRKRNERNSTPLFS